MDAPLPAIGHLTPEWVDFLIMAGAIALVAIGALIWTFFLRKPGRRRRRKLRHHHEHRLPNPTLAQNGGLPPVRQEEKPPGQQMPTTQP
jgi:peptidoglycan/LPS O-acetylase OafA/YrhL